MSDVSWLRRPSAPLWLLGITFGVALAVAVVLASWRSLFEGLVREKYGTADAAAQATIARLTANETWTASALELEQLYRHFMRGGDGLDEFGRRLAAIGGVWLPDRVERTLAAGTFEQRCRALSLVRTTNLLGARDALDRAVDRARAIADTRLIEALTTTAQALR